MSVTDALRRDQRITSSPTNVTRCIIGQESSAYEVPQPKRRAMALIWV